MDPVDKHSLSGFWSSIFLNQNCYHSFNGRTETMKSKRKWNVFGSFFFPFLCSVSFVFFLFFSLHVLFSVNDLHRREHHQKSLLFIAFELFELVCSFHGLLPQTTSSKNTTKKNKNMTKFERHTGTASDLFFDWHSAVWFALTLTVVSYHLHLDFVFVHLFGSFLVQI